MRRGIPLVVALVSVFVAAASLVLPWLAIGTAPGRSSIDLIASANALDVVGGATLALIIGTWLAIPVAAAVALLLGALGRPKAAAAVVLVVSACIGLVAAAIAATDAVALAWGGALGGIAAALGGGSAVGALLDSRAQPSAEVTDT